MLPDFPKIKAKRIALLQLISYQKALERHPILKQLKAHAVPEGDDWSSISIDGYTESGYQTMQASLSFEVSDIPKMDDVLWIERICDQLCGPIADQQMDCLLKKMDEVTATTGNIIDAKEQSLPEVILDTLEKIGLGFDNSGRPIFPTMLVGKEMFAKVQAMETPDDFEKRQNEIVQRKRAEWRMEQADRKLVD